MDSELLALEHKWLNALQAGDTFTLNTLLDDAFVCMPSKSQPSRGLLLRGEYLRYASRRRFKNCELYGVNVRLLGKFAVMECRFTCNHHVGLRTWSAQFSINDTWVQRDEGWKALNRDSANLPIERKRVRLDSVER